MPLERIFITYQPIGYRPSASDPAWQSGAFPTGAGAFYAGINTHMQINYQDQHGNIRVLEAHPSDQASEFEMGDTKWGNGQAYIRT